MLLIFVAGVLVIGIGAALLLRPRPLQVLAPSPDPAASAVCAALAPRLPATVQGQGRTATAPISDRTAAWGDPAVVLRCGVGRPATLTVSSELTTVDGVDWLPERTASGYRYTTVGRTANVQVLVPAGPRPEADALVDLSAVIALGDPPTSSTAP